MSNPDAAGLCLKPIDDLSLDNELSFNQLINEGSDFYLNRY
jgi:hypothetical protein